MAFVTDSVLKQALADRLKKPIDELEAYWDREVTRANAWSYQEIVQALVIRGYTKEQIDAWDYGAVYQTDLGLWKLLSDGAGLEGYDMSNVEKLDCRAALKELILIDADTHVYPNAGQPGLVTSSGPTAEGGMFNWPDPDDPNLGQYTDW